MSKKATRSPEPTPLAAPACEGELTHLSCGVEDPDITYEWDFEADDSYDAARSLVDATNELEQKLDELFSEYPDKKIYAFDASGRVGTQYKVSFHFLVRGAGFYLCGAYVPKLAMEGMDDSVYKAEGKQQKFRLPFASKDGKTRVLRRVVMDEDGDLTFYDDINEIEDELEEEYKEYQEHNLYEEYDDACEEHYEDEDAYEEYK